MRCIRANRLADEVTAWALASLAAGEAGASSTLREGWTIDEDGALLLRSALGGLARPADMDLTGFEATHNHVHLDPTGDEDGERARIWSDALGLLYAGLQSATAAVGGRRCVGIASLGGVGRGATVRWHLDRDEPWASHDLDGYESEAVLVMASEDVKLGRLWPLTGDDRASPAQDDDRHCAGERTAHGMQQHSDKTRRPWQARSGKAATLAVAMARRPIRPRTGGCCPLMQAWSPRSRSTSHSA